MPLASFSGPTSRLGAYRGATFGEVLASPVQLSWRNRQEMPAETRSSGGRFRCFHPPNASSPCAASNEANRTPCSPMRSWRKSGLKPSTANAARTERAIRGRRRHRCLGEGCLTIMGSIFINGLFTVGHQHACATPRGITKELLLYPLA